MLIYCYSLLNSQRVKFILKQKDFLKEGDLIINVASMPIASKGMSNMLRMSYA